MAETDLPAGAWTEVIGTAPATFIEMQNQGPSAIRVAIAASQPSTATDGIIFAPGEADRVTVGLNKLYARPLHDTDGKINTRND